MSGIRIGNLNRSLHDMEKNCGFVLVPLVFSVHRMVKLRTDDTIDRR